MRDRAIQFCLIVTGLLGLANSLQAMEHVTVLRDSREIDVTGRVLVEAQDGGLLLVSPDGVYWPIQPTEIVDRFSDDTPFQPLTQPELARQLLDQLPLGFRIHDTANYVICYNTSEAYAVWCGSLFERLYRGFYGYWKNRGLELKPPTFPLSALLFDSRASFANYAKHELGSEATAVIGYYSMETNRMTTYDLTGADGLRRDRRRLSSAAHINRILSQPNAERTVATIVHEATHQLAHNSGLQTRYAPNPVWVSEGIAVYFETPDLSSSRGWRSIGSVNRLHLNHFQRSIPQRPRQSLFELLDDDQRFRQAETSADAYADAWAFNYFLLQTRRHDYASYLRQLSQLRPLEKQTVQQRRERFQAAFGTDLDQLNQDFLRFMQKVR